MLEGSLSPVDCVDHPNCANSDHCVSLSIWKKMKVALDEVVDNITLADMAAEYAEKYGKKIITSSDAHYLWDINERGAYIEFDCGRENAAQALINYLRGAV